MPLPQSTIVKYIVAEFVLIVAAIIVFAQRWVVRDHAVVRGETHQLDMKIGALLRSRRDSTRYLIFQRELADSGLVGARVRFRGPTVLSDLVVTADSGRVDWTTGQRYGSRWALGLVVHVRGRYTIPADATATADTLDLGLPGLQPLALRFGDVPLLARSEHSRLVPGDSDAIRELTIYPSASAAGRAADRWSYFGVALVVAAVLLLYRLVTTLRSTRR
ncbi:MAG: hypothetical protein ABJD07_16600 [Gemmatimonadaceae bacterium]